MDEREQLSQDLMSISYLINFDWNGSYYKNKSRIDRSLDILNKCIENCNNSEDICEYETMIFEELYEYIDEVNEKDSDKQLSDLENVVRLIQQELAEQLINEEFDYSNVSELKREIGIDETKKEYI